MSELFERASRKKIRFSTSKGNLMAEDLWDLPLTQLDTVARGLHKLNQEDEISFIKKTDNKESLVKLQFDVVKYVIDTKLEEKAEAERKAERKAKREKILEIMEQKQDAKLADSSMKDLRKLLKDLED